MDILEEISLITANHVNTSMDLNASIYPKSEGATLRSKDDTKDLVTNYIISL